MPPRRRCRRTRRIVCSSGRPNSASISARASCPGNGGNRSCKLARSSGDLFAEEIGSGRQELAELDEARPQLAECRGEPLARTRRVCGRAARQGAADPQERAGAGTASKGNSASWRASVTPIRTRRARLRPLAEQPEPGSECVRAAKPNGAQRRPRSGCETCTRRAPRGRSSQQVRSAAGNAGCSRRDRRRRRDRR